MNQNIFGFVALLSVVALVFPAEPDCSQHPPQTNLQLCCRKPVTFPEDIEEKCTNYVLRALESEYRGFPQPCFAECAFNEIGLTENGKIIKDDLDDYVNMIIPKNLASFIPVFQESFRKCIFFFKENDKNASQTTQERSACNSLPGKLLLCVNANSFVHCPSDIWKSDDLCEATRVYIKACSIQKQLEIFLGE